MMLFNSLILEFSLEKFTLYFVPTVLLVFILIIGLILGIYHLKNRKSEEKNMEKNIENTQNTISNTVKTVYTNTQDNFSGTEFLPIPEKISTKEFDFEFAGWDKCYVDENGNDLVNAIFIKKPKYYKINVYGDDKSNPLASYVVNYGTNIDLSELTPTKESNEEFDYEFVGFDKETTNIDEDKDVFAIFKPISKNGEEVLCLGEEQDLPDEINETETLEQESIIQDIEDIENLEDAIDVTQDNNLASNEITNNQMIEVEENYEPSNNEEEILDDIKLVDEEKILVDSNLTDEEDISNDTNSVYEKEITHADNNYTDEDIQEEEFAEIDYSSEATNENYFDSNYAEESNLESAGDLKNQPQENLFIMTDRQDNNGVIEDIKPYEEIDVAKNKDNMIGKSRSKNGFKIEIHQNMQKPFSIDVDNKSSSIESDDIFKRIGVNMRQPKQLVNNQSPIKINQNIETQETYDNPIMSGPFKSRKMEKNKAYFENENAKQEEVKKNNKEDDTTEAFLTSNILVNHRKTVK